MEICTFLNEKTKSSKDRKNIAGFSTDQMSNIMMRDFFLSIEVRLCYKIFVLKMSPGLGHCKEGK